VRWAKKASVWLRRDGCRDGRPQYCFFVRWGFICLFSLYAAKLSFPFFLHCLVLTIGN